MKLRWLSGRRLVVAVFVTLLAASCTGASATEKEIAKYDRSEVQMPRDQAKANGLQADDETPLSTLQFRRNCQVMKSYLAAKASGGLRERFFGQYLLAQRKAVAADIDTITRDHLVHLACPLAAEAAPITTIGGCQFQPDALVADRAIVSQVGEGKPNAPIADVDVRSCDELARPRLWGAAEAALQDVL